MRKIILFIVYTIFLVVIIPGIITFYYSKNNKTPINKDENIVNSIDISNEIQVYNPETELKTSPDELEEYIKGVLAAEMPVSFETEALKAQAVAARTYAVKHLENKEKIEPDSIGQAYITVEEMKKNWGKNFEKNYDKINSAVESTRGQIMIYNNEPIEAVFHSTSAGVTETAENIWGGTLPYIKSVDSSLDKNAPNFETDTKVKISDFINIIKSKYKNINLTNENILNKINIKERSQAGYVTKVEIDSQPFTGMEIRQLFKLRSTNFTIKEENGYIIFHTKGYGHGAGMSQYGANFMAKEGSKYNEILNHYYIDIEIQTIRK